MPIFLAGIHFMKKKYGDYDRKNYKKIDIYFSNYNKKKSLLKIFKNLYEKKSI